MSTFSKPIIALVVIALLAAACATPTPAPTTAATTEAPTAISSTIDCMGAKSGDTLTLMYQWTGSEEVSANKIFQPLVDACGIKISAESTRDAAVLDTRVKSTPPDILFWPSSSPVSLYQDKMVNMTTDGADTANYASYWIDLGTFSNTLYAIPVKADIKSIIWYSPARFQALGYTVPTTFADLQTLVDKMATDGNVPWSMGFENGAATGWTGSDFIQDLLLTLQGPQYVLNIINGTTPYNDPGVVAAYQIYQKWASDPKYTVGGANGTLNTSFLNAIYLVFQPNPEAMMVKQSGFAGGEIATQFPTLVYGTDYDFFAFPGIKGMQGGADWMMAFSSSNAAKAMVAYLTSAYGGKVWAQTGFDESPNKGANGNYTDPQLIKKAAALASAQGFTPDLGDTLGEPFTSAEWTAIIQVVQGTDIATALAPAAAAQKQITGK